VLVEEFFWYIYDRIWYIALSKTGLGVAQQRRSPKQARMKYSYVGQIKVVTSK